MSTLNVLGLCVCLNGIGLHVYHKWKASSSPHRLGANDNDAIDEGDDEGIDGRRKGRRWIEMSEIKSWERKKQTMLHGGDEIEDDNLSTLPLMSTSDQ